MSAARSLAVVFTALATLACAGIGGQPGDRAQPLLDAQAPALGHCLPGDPPRCGLIDLTGRWLLGPELAEVPSRPDGSFVARRLDGQQVIVDREGPRIEVRELPFEGPTTEVSEGVFGVWPDGRSSPAILVDVQGRRVGDLSFSRLTFPDEPHRTTANFPWSVGRRSVEVFRFQDGLAPACQSGGGCGYIRPDGSWAFDAAGPTPFSAGRAFVRSRRLIDTGGGEVRKEVLPGTRFSEGLAWAQIDVKEDRSGALRGPWALLRPDGRAVKVMDQAMHDDQLPFSEGRSVVQLADGLAFVTDTGEIKPAPAQTAWLHSVFDGRALFATHPKGLQRPQRQGAEGPFGYLDEDGKVAIAPAFAPPPSEREVVAMHFSEGRAAARPADAPDKGWGYIDRDGQWVIPPGFQAAEPFSGGVARVRQSGDWLWIDGEGRPLPVRD